MTTTSTIPGIAFPLSASDDINWVIDDKVGGIGVVAKAQSDIFVDPSSGSQVNAETLLNASTLLGVPPAGDFRFHARVTVGFEAKYDAGALLIWFDERHWAKLCFEYSPEAEPMIVSVVTRDVSDDANSAVVDGRSVWLRVARVDGVFAYHWSVDGSHWRFVRAFALDGSDDELRVGFEVQSPTGDGCAVIFDHIEFASERLGDLRDGS